VIPRLSNAALGQLPSNVRRSNYDRSALKNGVVHIGLGAFHRAHQAPVFQSLAEQGDLRWGVVGASLRSASVRDSLAPQDFLYSLAVDDCGTREISVVEVISNALVAPEDPSRLVEAIAGPDVQIVTVTVTEKGYKLDPLPGALAQNDNEVASDFADLRTPRTMPGYLVAGLRVRRHRKLPPITIISCDNIAGNGWKLCSRVTELARTHDPSLADWIEDECAFPATMVDRIVPATREIDIETMAAQLGAVDFATVRTEPFTQWVIEDRFAGGRPDFEAAGVHITSDIAPWEQGKLRLLNGAHSAMAYLGVLAGIPTVDRFVAEAWGFALIERLWDEVEPTLGASLGLDIVHYRAVLMDRFSNSTLGHRLQQIAMDGSQKLPQRLVGPALDLIETGQTPMTTALVIAAWIRCQSGKNDTGDRFEVDDPIAPVTTRLTARAHGSRELTLATLGLDSIFPPRLAANGQFVTLVTDRLEELRQLGAKATVERFLENRK
jgi:fructuronate reductase